MRVFIVENSLAARASLQSVLSDMSAIKVVGKAMDGDEAIERINALAPDVVILDLMLQSGCAGLEVLECVKKGHADIRFIVFTHYTDEDCVERCRQAGADYFFDKSHQLMQLREVLWKWTHTDRLESEFRPGKSVKLADHSI